MKLVVDNSQKLVIGLGGAGCSILDKLPEDSPFPRLFINTDDSCIERNLEHCLFFSAGRSITAQSNERIEELDALLDDYSEIFIVVGLGGKAGSQLALSLADLANKKDIVVSGFVTLPFSFEGERIDFAKQTLVALKKRGCDLFIYDHDSEEKDKDRMLQDHFDKASEVALQSLYSA